MFYRFVDNPQFKGSAAHHEARRVINVRMLELGLDPQRETIEPLMAQKGLGDYDIEFWFTQKGFDTVGKHLGAEGIAFKWYQLDEIDDSLILFQDDLQVAAISPIFVGQENFFAPDPNENRYWEVVKERTPVRVSKPAKAAETKAPILPPNVPTTFERNWTHLAVRHAYRQANKLDELDKDKFALSPNFTNWCKSRWEWVSKKLRTDARLYIEHEPMSDGDWTNYHLRQQVSITDTYTDLSGNELPLTNPRTGKQIRFRESAPNKHLIEAFPVSQELEDHFANYSTGKVVRKIDEKIREWNPRVRTIESMVNFMNKIDEFGIELSEEYIEYPEIIGEMMDLEIYNPQFVGLDEYDDEVYSDFDHEGIFQPSGNPDNSSDTRDDVDLSDHTNYRSQDWQSIDLADDHHVVESYYRQECVTETPQFDEKTGEISDWTTVQHADTAEPVTRIDDEDWLKDARNWMTRENLLANTKDDDIRENIASAYPVSNQFMDYLAENEVDWTVASERLESIIGKPDTITTDIEWV